ncbi:MAG: Na/Pi cotransporter family protein [Mailhella sp.]|nr:Na/Pi cotransporter family protein [Mailhella sp.]
MNFVTVMQLFGGIGIFLYAIKLISDSLQQTAGDRLRGIISMFTKTPLLGVMLGTAATVVIQSSSATTVMTVSFVEAGIMNLMQAIGVIMGANIGTTVTGQILAFRVKDYAYLFVIIGVILHLAAPRQKFRTIGAGLLGFGLLFIGMQTMESSMAFLRSRQDIFVEFSRNPFMGLAAGTLLTLLIQSSSATVGLTIALGSQGIIPLEAAIPIILGDNIGTTITAVLAALGTGRTARQACAAHVLFNIIGVCIFLPMMPLYLGMIQSTSSSIGHQIANAHTLFNLCNTLLFLPFVRPFAALIRRIIPDSAGSSRKLTHFLDLRLIEHTPVVAVAAVRRECHHMGELVLELFDRAGKAFFTDDISTEDKVAALENDIDAIEAAIREYALKVMQAGISEHDVELLDACTASAGELERIADKGTRMLDFLRYRKEHGAVFSPLAQQELRDLYNDARKTLALSLRFLDEHAVKDFEVIADLSAKVRSDENELRTNHFERLSRGECSASSGLAFIDTIGAIEQISYRARRMAEVLMNSDRI